MAIVLLDRIAPTAPGAVTNGTVRAYGPKLSSDSSACGWSLQSLSATKHTTDMSTAANGGGYCGFATQWNYINKITLNGSNKRSFMAPALPGSLVEAAVTIQPASNGNFWLYTTVLTDSGVAIPMNRWFKLRCYWRRNGTTQMDVTYQYRLAGSSTWGTIGTITTTSGWGSYFNKMYTVVRTYGSDPGLHGRIGVVTVCHMDSVADLAEMADEVDPPTPPYQWYVDPVGGDDNADGSTPTTPWQSVTKLATEDTAGTFFRGASAFKLDGAALDPSVVDGDVLAGYYKAGRITAGSDTIWVQGNLGQEIRITSSVTLSTPGIALRGRQGVPCLSQFKILASGVWAATGGHAGVYQTTDWTTGLGFWQSRMLLPSAASLVALDGLDHGYYDSGATLYVKPRSAVDPTNAANDGVFERSAVLGNGPTGVVLLSSGLLRNLKVIGTGQPNGGYCFGTNGTYSMVVFHDLVADWGGKHVLGNVTTSINGSRSFRINIDASRQWPGGWTDVEYSDAGTNNQYYYENVTMSHGCTMVVDQAEGSTVGSAFGSHGGATYEKGWFVNCDMPATGGVAGIQSAATALTIRNCRMYPDFGAAVVTADNCYFYDWYLRKAVYRNCLFVLPGNSYDNSNGQHRFESLNGASWTNCTFDLRAARNFVFYFYSGTGTNTIRNCAFLLGNYPVWYGFAAATLPTLSNSAYQGATSAVLCKNYNDGSTTADRTLAQIQTAGNEAASTIATSIGLHTSLQPLAASSLLHAGVAGLVTQDYAGATWATRDTIGAYQSAAVTLVVPNQTTTPNAPVTMTATGVDAAGTGFTITDQIAWAKASGIGTIDSSSGAYSATQAGAATITATVGSVVGTGGVTVQPARSSCVSTLLALGIIK